MDAISDRRTREVVVMAGSQVGKTELELNVVGYYADHDPCAILVVLPTVELAKAWSSDRLAPMLRDTPGLAEKIPAPTAKDSSTTLLHRSFRGGHVTLAGANSPASLSSRPCRIVLLDETSRFPSSAGAEGNPKRLAEKRSQNYHNRKLVQVSSPTDEYCQVAVDYQASTRERYFVPCPHCGHRQVLVWKRVIWPKGHPERARYHCEARECEKAWTETQRRAAVAWGEWRAEDPHARRRGFHIPGLLSRFRSLPELALDFTESAEAGPEDLQTFVNLELGEVWREDEDEALTPEYLYRTRRERYEDALPVPAVLLTCGVDVHPDRLELELVAHSATGETWSLDYRTLAGNTDQLSDPGTWKALDTYRANRWPHAGGKLLPIAGMAVDSGGHNTDIVYRYCKAREADRIYPIKGRGGPGLPVIAARSRNNRRRALLFTLGVDEIKTRLRRRLAVETPGPRFCHFPVERELAYFEQLLAESAVVRWHRGQRRVVWDNPRRARNEAFDCRVYALAMVEILSPDWDRLEATVNGTGPTRGRTRRRSWVRHWR